MLSVNVPRGATLERLNCDAGGEIPDSAVWLDLHAPPRRRTKLVEQALHVALPTRAEMQEIEITSRLYVEDGARYMAATLMCNSDSEAPRTTLVTFILPPFRKAIRITPCEPCPRASRKNLKGTPAGKWHLF
jgi:magnesium transporter